MSLIIAMLMLGIIIMIHEFGHFLFAKLNGIGVIEFSLGMGPRLFSFEKGGTRYSFKILPFGGSCMMLGEDEGITDESAFNNKSVWARISVVAAGPVFNFILAFGLSMVLIGITGYELEPVFSAENNQYMMGVQFNPVPSTVENIGQLLVHSAYEVQYWIHYVFDTFYMMFHGMVSVNDISGPVGIVNAIDTTVDETAPYGLSAVVLMLINFTILLSANLGVMNLLPIPALDGGRLVFLIIEAVRGKPIDKEKEGMVHMAGMMVLLALMVLILFNDVRKLF